MSIVLDERADGSLAVFIDGDLQFDSRDEGLYHELLTLPALAFVTHRKRGPLRVLVCGGGDGLCARELLKSDRVKSIDLVDYDPQIIELARTVWPHINDYALDNPRLRVHIEDAITFVAEAQRYHRTYDVIICDFTVPRDMDGARLHSLEWYSALQALCEPHTVLAINAASPAFTPLAYWSIYNTVRLAKLHARPYRFVLPSFSTNGYGDDWGFILASPQTIRLSEFRNLHFAEPRRFVETSAQFQRCFAFPSELAAQRDHAHPTTIGSDWLLQQLFNPSDESAVGIDWTSLDWNHDPSAIPEPHSTTMVLPDIVKQTIQGNPTLDEAALFAQVIEVMPSLRSDHTRAMVSEFVEEPSRFLRSIDLRGIVDALLKRAAELPKRFVAELRLLRAQLRRSWSNPNSLLQKGLRVVSVIALVIILSNILHPDTAYGKGGSTSGTGGGYSGPALSRTSSPYDVVLAPPSTVSGRGFSSNTYGRGSVVDEVGNYYPTRSYRYSPSYYGGNSYRSYNRTNRPEDPNEGEALYRLTPETDVLAGGEIAVALTDQTYLLLADQVNSVVDNQTGLPIIFLKRDDALVWRTAQELNRQRTGLTDSVKAKQDWINWMSWIGFAPWREDDERELANINRTTDILVNALKSLGQVPAAQPSLPLGPFLDGYQLFTGVWVANDGSVLALEQPEGPVFLNNCTSWYNDSALSQPNSDPMPADLCSLLLVPYLTKQANEANAIQTRLASDLDSAQKDLRLLKSDKTIYESIQKQYGPSDIVEYGTSDIPVSQALTLTNNDLTRTEQLIQVLEKEQQEFPGRSTAISRILNKLK